MCHSLHHWKLPRLLCYLMRLQFVPLRLFTCVAVASLHNWDVPRRPHAPSRLVGFPRHQKKYEQNDGANKFLLCKSKSFTSNFVYIWKKKTTFGMFTNSVAWETCSKPSHHIPCLAQHRTCQTFGISDSWAWCFDGLPKASCPFFKGKILHIPDIPWISIWGFPKIVGFPPKSSILYIYIYPPGN